MHIRQIRVRYAAFQGLELRNMTQPTRLLGISNAIVDVLSHVDRDFLDSIGAPPGSMTLIDEARAKEIYAMMGPATEMSGGSVANTIAGFANLGGDAAYIGRVNDDQLGEIFVHDMRSIGVDIRLPPREAASPTARCHVRRLHGTRARRCHPGNRRRTRHRTPGGLCVGYR
jgi:sugar/nucleoside kinase (ribokinase family)